MNRLGFPLLLLALAIACESITEFEDRFPSGQLRTAGTLVGGQQEGLWTYYYESGEPKARGTYRDDIQEGDWTYWYSNGQKEMEGAFRNERRVGPWTYWHPSGALRARGRFVDGRETGAWTFFDANGVATQSGDFLAGKRHLLWEGWQGEGEPKSVGFYYRGERVGPWRFFDADGTAFEKSYPVPDGLECYEEHWPDGTLRRAGFVQDGQAVGLWASWHENGRRRASGELEGGVPSGSWTAFDEEGELMATGVVERGQLRGLWQLRSETGELQGREVGQRPAPVWSGNWSSASEAMQSGPEGCVEIWLAEIASERIEEPRAVVAKDAPSSAMEKDEIVRAPIRPQPWTVRETEFMSDYIERYTTGESERLRRSSFYAPESNERAPVRRGDLERSRPLLGRRLPVTRFESVSEGVIDLEQHRDKKLLLVLLRGFAGQVCVYCATQTKALSPSLSTFESLDTEVVIVYPGPESGMDAFVEAYVNTFDEQSPPPYTLLYDPDLRLAEELGLTGNLAIPTSLVIDEEGVIQWAYVGKTIDDRPSTQQLLDVLRRMQ